MAKALKILGLLNVAVAALSFPVAWGIASTATDAYMIAGKDPSTRDIEEGLFEAPKGATKDSKEYRDAVLRIYGMPTDETTSVVFWPKEKFIHPQLLPSITILPVYKEKGENPWQLKTIYFFATRICIVATIGGLVFLGVASVAAKKKAAPAPPAA